MRRRKRPNAGDPRIVGDLEQAALDLVAIAQLALDRVGILDHRSELEHQEQLAPAPDAALAEEHGAARVKLDHDRQQKQQRRQQQQARAAPTMSMARFSAAEDLENTPYCRTPSNVIPSTSSNVDDEPTTSSRRGQDADLDAQAP